MAITEFSKNYHEKMFPFLKITNEVFEVKGISLPLPPQATTTAENRREAVSRSLPAMQQRI